MGARMICPRCSQPYLRISTLLNPARTIYVHTETKGAGKQADGQRSERKPIIFCMGVSQLNTKEHQQLQAAIANTQIQNEKNMKKNVASKNSDVIKFNKVQDQYEETRAKTIEENKKVAKFKEFNFEELKKQFPSKGFGGREGSPSISISDKGRIVFSSAVAKALSGCTYVQPLRDVDNPLGIQFNGHPELLKGKENSWLKIIHSKDTRKDGTKAKSHQVALESGMAILMLKSIGYDYAKVGNQTYKVTKLDNEKHSVAFGLPAPDNYPARKPKQPRKPKVAKETPAAAATKTNGGAPSTSMSQTSAASRAAMGQSAQSQPQGDDELIVE